MSSPKVPPDSDVPGDFRAPNLHVSYWPSSWTGWPQDPPPQAQPQQTSEEKDKQK